MDGDIHVYSEKLSFKAPDGSIYTYTQVQGAQILANVNVED